jgi:hypothetical protein
LDCRPRRRIGAQVQVAGFRHRLAQRGPNRLVRRLVRRPERFARGIVRAVLRWLAGQQVEQGAFGVFGRGEAVAGAERAEGRPGPSGSGRIGGGGEDGVGQLLRAAALGQ